MTRIHWQDHIVIDPEIHHGEPYIKGTRISVAVIVGSIADGMTIDDGIREYPQLGQATVRAALSYAADVVRQDILLPLAG
jgi:uncharacterized protein (DUF433 family)/predicted nuclease of predicted toxin-antitoxin system